MTPLASSDNLFPHKQREGKILTHRKIHIILALLVLSIFLFQNCATIIRGKSQKIPVTSNPIGAKIIVNGIEIGNTPIELKLKRKKSHLIRIEKQGYNPFEIRITRKSSLVLSILGNLFFGVASGFLVHYVVWQFKGKPDEEMVLYPDLVLGFFLGWTGFALADSSLGGSYTLSPKVLSVTLTKIEEKAQPNFILIDTEQFQNIKWIRIKCADSDIKDEVINLYELSAK